MVQLVVRSILLHGITELFPISASTQQLVMVRIILSVAKAHDRHSLGEGGEQQWWWVWGTSAIMRADYSPRHTRPHARHSKICIESQRSMVVWSSCLPAESFGGALHQEGDFCEADHYQRLLRTTVTCTQNFSIAILLHKAHIFHLNLVSLCVYCILCSNAGECWIDVRVLCSACVYCRCTWMFVSLPVPAMNGHLPQAATFSSEPAVSSCGRYYGTWIAGYNTPTEMLFVYTTWIAGYNTPTEMLFVYTTWIAGYNTPLRCYLYILLE